MNKIITAAKLANKAHACQYRKDGSPYILHCMRVAGLVTLVDNVTEDMICAAYLHDVAEDCDPIHRLDIVRELRSYVLGLVLELTNEYKKSAYPYLNRKERKKRELERISKISPEAKTIKCCDRYDNLSDMFLLNDSEFNQIYLAESKLLYDVLEGADARARLHLKKMINKAEEKIVATLPWNNIS